MKNFFATLIDSSFKNYVTRQVAGVLYLISLIFIGIAVVAAVAAGALRLTQGYPEGILFILGGPLVGLLVVILTRLLFESSVALVAIAENTSRK